MCMHARELLHVVLCSCMYISITDMYVYICIYKMHTYMHGDMHLYIITSIHPYAGPCMDDNLSTTGRDCNSDRPGWSLLVCPQVPFKPKISRLKDEAWEFPRIKGPSIGPKY